MFKKYNWGKVFVIFSLVTLLVFFFQYFKQKEVNYMPTAYENELISYFKEIALQTEYGENPQRVIKWKEPMMLYVMEEEKLKVQMPIIKNTIDVINQLATDGFSIVLTKNLSKSNSVLYLCKKEQVAELDPQFFKIINNIDYDITGYAYCEFITKTSVIKKAIIFISSEYSLDIQEASILEEISQSLGLAFDSSRYSNSIFYKDKSEQKVRVNNYSELDKDIIRLLYHPQMRSGLDSIELEKIIKVILKAEKD